MAQVSESPYLPSHLQDLIASLYGQDDPLWTSVLALVEQAGIAENFPAGPNTPAELVTVLSAVLNQTLPKATGILAPVTVPGDGTPTLLTDPQDFGFAPGIPTLIQMAVRVHAPTSTIDDVDIDTDPIADGLFGYGAAVALTGKEGLGTDTVAVSGSSLLTWADYGQAGITASVTTADGSDAEVQLVSVRQLCVTSRLVTP